MNNTHVIGAYNQLVVYCDAMGIDELKKLAKNACENAYAPQSRFKVGSAIRTTNGKVYAGCNVESLSLIFTICAERNAISSAIAGQGNVEIDLVVIYSPTSTPSSPCGACRQAIFEFGKNARVHSFCDSSQVIDTTIKELLPHAFDLEVMD